MFITVAKMNERYSFAVGDNPHDDTDAMFWSFRDFFLVDGIPSTYRTFGEAHAQGVRVMRTMPSTVMAKKVTHYKVAREGVVDLLGSEDHIVSHFNNLVDIIGERVSSLETMEAGHEKDDESIILANEIDGVITNIESLLKEIKDEDNIEELNDAVEKLKDMKAEFTPEAAKETGEEAAAMPAAPDLGGKLASKVGHAAVKGIAAESKIRSFAESAMQAIQPSHAEVFVGSVTQSPDNKIYATLSEPIEGGVRDLILMVFGSDLLMRRVIPFESVNDACPYESEDFFRKYWEPIIASVGHIKFDGIDAVAMPSASPKGWDSMEAYSVDDGSKKMLKVSYSEGKPRVWWVHEAGCGKLCNRTAASKFRESDLVPGTTEVRCINRGLPTYYGRTGTVVSVKPRRDYADITIDFRRGLGEVVMTDADVEMVVLPS